MAKIIVRDLSENLELDRKAMQSIAGGSRVRAQGKAGAVAGGPRIVDFKTGVAQAPSRPTVPRKPAQ